MQNSSCYANRRLYGSCSTRYCERSISSERNRLENNSKTCSRTYQLILVCPFCFVTLLYNLKTKNMKFYLVMWLLFAGIFIISIGASLFERTLGHETNSLVYLVISVVSLLGCVVTSYFNEQQNKKQ